jgi:hypothetical protein
MKTCPLVLVSLLATALNTLAWDYEGHRVVNQLALASLPTNFPAFALTPEARERVAFLAGEPDRWRNSQDCTFRHVNEPDHFLDIEFLAGYGFSATNTPSFRYDFVSALAVVRSGNPAIEPHVNVEKDVNHTQAFFGFLPWAINENYSKLKSGFAYLKTFEQYGGTPAEIQNAQQDIVYVMGVMGHYVGDSAQPLHVTEHHHGWVGANTNGYTTKSSFHSWIDGGYFSKTGFGLPEMFTNVAPAKLVPGANARNEGVFPAVMTHLAATHGLVEPLYALEKAGKLSGDGTVGLEGKPFLQKQLLVGGQLLGDIWFTAWQTAPEDSFLKSQLQKRAAAAAAPLAPPTGLKVVTP